MAANPFKTSIAHSFTLELRKVAGAIHLAGWNEVGPIDI